MSLLPLYQSHSFHVTELSNFLLVGFREDSVSFIVKEIWNPTLLTLFETDQLYTELQRIGEKYNCNHYRIVAHGGYLEEALSFELHGLAVSDESYIESLAGGNHVELFSHNEAAYRAIENGFRNKRMGAVVQATGTGKSYLIARYIVEHASEEIVVIAPTVTILSEIQQAIGKKTEHVTYKTFQALSIGRTGETPLKAAHIIIDEFHHFGAEVWGKAVQEVIDSNPGARVLGMSATPVRPEQMLDTVEVYFQGNLFYELTLSMAWYYRILPVPVLVQSVFDINKELDRVQRKLDHSHCTAERRRRIQEKLDFARLDFRGSYSAPKLISRYLPKSVRKLLVFCKDKEDLEQMKPEVAGWLLQAGFEIEIFEVHNGKTFRENERTLKAFREEKEKLHVLFSINMLIEGLHVEGVEAAMFLRRTESYVVALQQLGRCLKAGSETRPVILDFVNNLSGRNVYEGLSLQMKLQPALRAPKTFRGFTEFEVTGFLSDIRAQVDSMLSELDAWPVMYERLLEFKEREQRWPTVIDGKLGAWCNTQRIARKKSTLSAEAIDRLDSIGFEWEVQDMRWMKCFSELKLFVEKEKRFPKRGENLLSRWCNTQRQARKKNLLSAERIALLDSLHFWWEQDLDQIWLSNWESTLAFYEREGRWPKTTDGRLGEWLNTQRKAKRLGVLSEDRLARMEKAGFLWGTDDIWLSNYEKLKAFHDANKRWPTSREGKLGSWCTIQRRAKKRGHMLLLRQQLLDAIGFPWVMTT